MAKTLIFCPNGLENDIDVTENFGDNIVYTVADCKYGYHNALNKLRESKDDFPVITDIPTFLNHEELWYDEEKQRWNVYMVVWKGKRKKKPVPVNIHDLTDRWLRQAHNIEKLFISGGFGELWENKGE